LESSLKWKATMKVAPDRPGHLTADALGEQTEYSSSKLGRGGLVVRFRRLMVALVVILGGLWFQADQAGAACPPPEDQIFVKNVTSSGSNITTYGSGETLFVTNRTLDTCDITQDFDVSAVSTTFEGNSLATKWIEVGWVEYTLANTTTKAWRLFYESDTTGGLDHGASIAAPSYLARFWLNHKVGGGSLDWIVHVDLDLDGVSDFNQAITSTFSSSQSRGETTRRGPNTSAGDDHTTLQYYNNTSWIDWPNNILDPNLGSGITGYHYTKISATEYAVLVN
jgi:hypothetical protein